MVGDFTFGLPREVSVVCGLLARGQTSLLRAIIGKDDPIFITSFLRWRRDLSKGSSPHFDSEEDTSLWFPSVSGTDTSVVPPSAGEGDVFRCSVGTLSFHSF